MALSSDYGRPEHKQPLALFPNGIPDWRRAKACPAEWEPTLTPIFPNGVKPSDSRRGMVIVAPGGGYYIRAEHERTPFAEFFADNGLMAAILDYRTGGEAELPLREGPLNDARRAIRVVRAHASAWGVRPDRIAMLGFSAGGHLTASAGVHWTEGNPRDADPVERVSSRLDAMALAYPVIKSGPHGHDGSMQALRGAKPTAEDLKFVDNDRWVEARTPPAFMFHTADDPVVPVEGALDFALALKKAEIPFEMHVFPSGPHGVGMGKEHPALAGWSGLMLDWLRRLDF